MPQKPKTVCDICGKMFVNVNLHKTKFHDVFELIQKHNGRYDEDYWTLKRNGVVFCTWPEDTDGASDWVLNREKKLRLYLKSNPENFEAIPDKVVYVNFPLKHEGAFGTDGSTLTKITTYQVE